MILLRYVSCDFGLISFWGYLDTHVCDIAKVHSSDLVKRQVLACLTSQIFEVRTAAVAASADVATVGDDVALEEARKALHHPSVAVRLAALQALKVQGLAQNRNPLSFSTWWPSQSVSRT